MRASSFCSSCFARFLRIQHRFGEMRDGVQNRERIWEMRNIEGGLRDTG